MSRSVKKEANILAVRFVAGVGRWGFSRDLKVEKLFLWVSCTADSVIIERTNASWEEGQEGLVAVEVYRVFPFGWFPMVFHHFLSAVLKLVRSIQMVLVSHGWGWFARRSYHWCKVGGTLVAEVAEIAAVRYQRCWSSRLFLHTVNWLKCWSGTCKSLTVFKQISKNKVIITLTVSYITRFLLQHPVYKLDWTTLQMFDISLHYLGHDLSFNGAA